MSLYIVATPIGNLDDISSRALDTLKTVDLILCEDTRVTKKLLFHYGIEKQTKSFHQHSTHQRSKEIVDLLKQGMSMALVSDAGTPGISDPGGLLIERLVQEAPEISIIPIPGPCALISALSISGFPTDQFIFLGFPPHKKGRQKFFDRLCTIDSTVVFYESKHRIEKTLLSLGERMPERHMMLCRELTKHYEHVYRGTVLQVTELLKTDSIKGEFVVVLSSTRRKLL